ncbi:MAG: pyridoxal-phosphate dependent enzyme [Candidatus Limnocylindrales bacterium]|nr:pyridoxal-phosphate dependent enzyme [Candidatus Limnocylindrales bacterium]
MQGPLTAVPLAAIEAARTRLHGIALRTPLVRLGLPDASPQILLKLENLQPIGSFKLRGAANAMALAGREALAHGVYTASAGNMAQGLAWCAREMGVHCRVIVPESAPDTKVAAIQRLGGEVIKVPFRPQCVRRLGPRPGRTDRARMHRDDRLARRAYGRVTNQVEHDHLRSVRLPDP